MQRSILLFVAIGAILTGCTVIPGPRGQSAQPTMLTRDFMILSNSLDQTVEGRRAQQVVVDILAAKGFVLQRKADLVLETGYSLRDHRIGFSAGENASATNSRSPDQSAARQGDPLAVCKEKIARLTVTLISRSDRQVAFKGSADDLRCSAPDSDNLAALANVATMKLSPVSNRPAGE